MTALYRIAVFPTPAKQEQGQCRQTLDQLQRCEGQGGTTVRPRLGQPVPQLLLVQRLQPL